MANNLSSVEKPARLYSHKLLSFLAVIVFGFNFLVPAGTLAGDSLSTINSVNLLAEHNRVRKENNLIEFKVNSKLNASASKKAEAMLNSNCWAHYCPNGKSPWEFFEENGYNYMYAGENLAEGFYTMDSVMTAWLNSPTHKENILKNEFNEIGFGFAYGAFQGNSNNIIVVVHFGNIGAVLGNEFFLRINKPSSNEVFNENQISVEGEVIGFPQVNIYTDNLFSGEASILSGIFTHKTSLLSDGNHTVFAEGVNSGGENFSTEVVNFKIDTLEQTLFTESFEGKNISFNTGLVVSSETKNLVNLFFVIVISTLFLLDFIVLSRTSAIKEKKSYSHFHFSIFVMLGCIILAGGFAGRI